MKPFRNLCRFSGLAVNEQDLSPSRSPNQHFLRDFERHLGPTQCGRPGGYDPQVWTLKLKFSCLLFKKLFDLEQRPSRSLNLAFCVTSGTTRDTRTLSKTTTPSEQLRIDLVTRPDYP